MPSENRAKAWSADAVDRKLNLSPHSAKAHLDEMLSQGLLTLVDEEERYGYQPPSDELNKMVNQLSNAYAATQRVSRTNNNFLKSGRQGASVH